MPFRCSDHGKHLARDVFMANRFSQLVLQITRFIVMSNHHVLHGPTPKKWPLIIAWLFSAAD
jgi:hypothetical protein